MPFFCKNQPFALTMYLRALVILFLFSCCLHAQETSITGKVVHGISKTPLKGIQITLGEDVVARTKDSGDFSFSSPLQGEFVLYVKGQGFRTLSLPIILDTMPLNLGVLTLEPDLDLEKTDNLITLTDADFSDDIESLANTTPFLQATRDIFLTRAAFDFSQAFFRVRGYDSREGQLLLNGVAMNKFLNGRPEWNNWGGLNDVLRNQEFSNGLEVSTFTFGGILGTTNIDLRPSRQRPGTRLSSSFSNRTYGGRVMATFNSGVDSKGLSFALSASRRWASQGYIEGTLYDAYSLFAAAEYQLNDTHSFSATAILAKNRRGRSSALTEEVVDLVGNKYNPYWGEQNGNIRNARERDIFEPLLLLNHHFKSKNVKVNSGIAFQTGKRSRSRLGYFNAPNPDPTYFRYLPSFYINNPIGADFTNAALAREGFLSNPQINWQQILTANSNPENLGKAAYLLQDDTVEDTQFSFNSTASLKLNPLFRLDFGLSLRYLTSVNYAKIADLLGAQFHEDIDPFSDTQNDVNGALQKSEDDLFNYHYDISALQWNPFIQLNVNGKSWNGFLSAAYLLTTYQRDGRFLNQRFPENSLGPSEELAFSNVQGKAGLSYQMSPRHLVQLHSAFLKRPPTVQNTFVNPRENNAVVPNLQSETLGTIDINYFMRLPKITGRFTAFYTRFQNTTDINFFFVDAGVGSDFVQEVITNLDKLHKGIEIGVEYQVSPQVKLSMASSIGDYVYASDPNVSINFDTAGADEDLIDPEGSIDLGTAQIKGLRLAQGPQTAFSLGIEYRDPNYWWIGATTNYLGKNYANISTITRTPSFTLDPETGAPFADATPENVARLLRQRDLDNFYLLNLVGGKSWLINGKYISFFASVNYVFDEVFRTGGFEQSRNGNFGQLQQDNLRNDPSFAPKYWYGFGRTFFLNLAISF